MSRMVAPNTQVFSEAVSPSTCCWACCSLLGADLEAPRSVRKTTPEPWQIPLERIPAAFVDEAMEPKNGTRQWKTQIMEGGQQLRADHQVEMARVVASGMPMPAAESGRASISM